MTLITPQEAEAKLLAYEKINGSLSAHNRGVLRDIFIHGSMEYKADKKQAEREEIPTNNQFRDDI